MNRFILVLSFILFSFVTAAADPTTPAPDPSGDPRQAAHDAIVRKIQALPWAPVHDLKLSSSGARLTDMPGFIGLSGKNAQTYRQLVQGSDDYTVEGSAIRTSNGSELVFSWHPEGYVDAKDFSEIDAGQLLESVRQATFAANAQSEAAGLRPITSVDWLRQPTWNAERHTAYWMLQGTHDDGERTVNAVALKLGRRGYEKMIWITSPDQIDRANDLTLAQDTFVYANGDRYEDHSSGDRMAAYGIAGLVAGVIGVKAVKGLGIVALLLGLKKFLVVLLLPFIWLFNKIKGLFGRGNDAS